MNCLRLRAPLVLLLAAACVACTPLRSRIKPPYVVDGVNYDEAGLQRYAAAQCSPAAAATPQPPHPFTTDGCSLWPDGAWKECCIVHDVSYWCAGPATRREVDRRLRACVDESSGSANAWLMYFGVRLGGGRLLPLPWRWGYGYPWPHPAAPEQQPAEDLPPAGDPATQD